MKKILTLLLCAGLLTSCSFRQFDGIATGSTLGGLFGSTIGGILGGGEGHDRGALIGMVAGGVAGAVVASNAEKKQAERYGEPAGSYRDDGYYYDNSISYGRSEYYDYESVNEWAELEVMNVQFKDRNGNRALDSNEEAFITFELRNRGHNTLHNVAPRISVSDKRISVSPVAIISRLEPGQGVRYKAVVRAKRRLHNGEAIFTITFGSGRYARTAKSFRIRTYR